MQDASHTAYSKRYPAAGAGGSGCILGGGAMALGFFQNESRILSIGPIGQLQ